LVPIDPARRINPKRRYVTLIALALIVVLAGGLILPAPALGASTYDFSLLELILNYITRYYPGTYNVTKLIEGAAIGMVNALGDPYSQYLTPDAYEALMSTLEGRFGGLGIYIDVANDGYIVIIAPIKGTPADRAGLRAGDKIATVDGTDIRGFDISVAQKMMRGEPGTKVKLGIIRPGVAAMIEVEITREIIEIDPVESKMLEGGVGYVALSSFNEASTERMDEALAELKAAGAQALVLDLRNNGGGLLGQAITLAARFLREGQTILSVRSKSGDPQAYKVNGSLYVGLPLVVLVNEGTASASEILAGAIKDNGTGQIVGTQTYGKGAIQNVWRFSNGGGLRLTTAHYYTPSGEALDGRGITPQHVVADPATSGSVPYLNWYRTIRHMRVGLDVLELEEVLRFLGLTYEADGIYGMTSVNAVKQFQLSQGVLHDGIVDEVTAQLLNRAVEAMISGDADPQLDKALEVLGTIK